MKKTFIVAFFALLTLGQSLEPTRDFLASFLKQSIHRDITLQSKIGSLFSDLLNQETKSIELLLQLYNGKDFSGKTLKSIFGEIVHKFMRENGLLQYINDSKIEQVTLTTGINEVLYQFAKGFFDGLKRSNTKCQCFEDLMKLKPLFLQRVDECIKKTQGGTNFFAAFQLMLKAIWYDLVAVKTPCRYNYLVIALDITWSQFIDKLIVHSWKIFPEFLKMVEGFKLNSAEQVGKGLGEILDIALDFYVY